MYIVQIMPDTAFLSSTNSIINLPIVGTYYTLSRHTNLIDAEVQQSIYQTQHPGYTIQIIQI